MPFSGDQHFLSYPSMTTGYYKYEAANQLVKKINFVHSAKNNERDDGNKCLSAYLRRQRSRELK